MTHILLEKQKNSENENEIYIFKSYSEFEKIFKIIEEIEDIGEIKSERGNQNNNLAMSGLNPRIFENQRTLKKAKQADWAKYGDIFVDFHF